MSFDRFQSEGVCSTPDIFSGGAELYKNDIKSPDFVLVDFIDANFPSSFQSKTDTYELINDSNNLLSQIQDENFDVDLNDLLGDDLLKDIDINDLISCSSFPSPSETNGSSSFVAETTINVDMIVPASSPTSSISSTDSQLSSKRTKLSPIERKLRKKNQNKTAAEKYRVKKKTELNQLADRHSSLKTLNKQLKNDLETWTARVHQLEQLLRDVVQVDLAL